MKNKNKKLPFKQTINLIEHKKALNKPVQTFSLIALSFLVLVLLAKFAVIDRYDNLSRQRAELATLQDQFATMQIALKDYDNVEEEYNRYTTHWMTKGEKTLVDRQDVMTLITQEISRVAEIQKYSIAENILSIDIKDITLDSTATLVNTLEARDGVEKVQVYTANSLANQGDTTSVSLIISLQNKEAITQNEANKKADNGGVK